MRTKARGMNYVPLHIQTFFLTHFTTLLKDRHSERSNVCSAPALGSWNAVYELACPFLVAAFLTRPKMTTTGSHASVLENSQKPLRSQVMRSVLGVFCIRVHLCSFLLTICLPCYYLQTSNHHMIYLLLCRPSGHDSSGSKRTK